MRRRLFGYLLSAVDFGVLIFFFDSLHLSFIRNKKTHNQIIVIFATKYAVHVNWSVSQSIHIDMWEESNIRAATPARTSKQMNERLSQSVDKQQFHSRFIISESPFSEHTNRHNTNAIGVWPLLSAIRRNAFPCERSVLLRTRHG